MAASTQQEIEEQAIEQEFSFVPDAGNHILLQTSVNAHHRKHTFKFKIGVNEQTFRLLQTPEASSFKSKVAKFINGEVSQKMLSLVPFKCGTCCSLHAVYYYTYRLAS